MIRFLLYMILGYFLWKLVAAFTSPGRPRREKPADAPTPPRPDFSNIKDAEFEELPPSSSADDPSASPKP